MHKQIMATMYQPVHNFTIFTKYAQYDVHFMQSWRQKTAFELVNHMAACLCCNSVKFSLIARLRSSVDWGEGENTRSFNCPHRKKSRGLRSGECGGHYFAVRYEMNLTPNVIFNRCTTPPAVCGVDAAAPSCWNNTLCMSKPFLFKDGTHCF